MASWKDVPFANEAKYVKAVAQAILAGVEFYIYRTVDGKVQKYKLEHLQLDFGNGTLHVHYCKDEFFNSVMEPATKQDLMLITQQARQLAQVQAK